MTKNKLKKIWKISFLGAGILFFLYCFQVSNLNYQSYQLTNFKKQKETLTYKITQKQLEITQKEPIFQMEELAKNLNFEKILTIQYIKTPPGRVVIKK